MRHLEQKVLLRAKATGGMNDALVHSMNEI